MQARRERRRTGSPGTVLGLSWRMWDQERVMAVPSGALSMYLYRWYCIRIIMESVGLGESHGCPFRCSIYMYQYFYLHQYLSIYVPICLALLTAELPPHNYRTCLGIMRVEPCASNWSLTSSNPRTWRLSFRRYLTYFTNVFVTFLNLR